MMKKIILLILTTINVFSWEINTHRAIERKASKASVNLKTFIKNAGIQNANYKNERLEGYHKNYNGDYTYLDYAINGEENGISDNKWNQTFNIYNVDYQSLIEAGSILEDAQWPHLPNTLDGIDRADGRFVNHFYDAQNGGKGLVTYIIHSYRTGTSWL